jgi:hypothetical protein
MAVFTLEICFKHKRVRDIMCSLITELKETVDTMDSNSKAIVKSEIKWSDVVAGRNVCGAEEVDTPIQNIKTIITSRKTQNVVERKRNGKESSI